MTCAESLLSYLDLYLHRRWSEAGGSGRGRADAVHRFLLNEQDIVWFVDVEMKQTSCRVTHVQKSRNIRNVSFILYFLVHQISNALILILITDTRYKKTV